MKCDFCHNNEARHHVHQIIGTERYDYHVCGDCAQKLNLGDGTVENMLRGTGRERRGNDLAECPECGMTRESVEKSRSLGCPACYEAFRDAALTMARETVDRAEHRGKLPESLMVTKKLQVTRQQLQKALARAVDEEQYELAAALRDQLNEITPEEEFHG